MNKMTLIVRRKPTRHKQNCEWRNCETPLMKKGSLQVVCSNYDRYARWISYSYFHPNCAFLYLITNNSFTKHFKRRYGELDAKSLYKVFKSRKWEEFSSDYIIAPFELMERFLTSKTKKETIKFLEDIFVKITYQKVFENG